PRLALLLHALEKRPEHVEVFTEIRLCHFLFRKSENGFFDFNGVHKNMEKGFSNPSPYCKRLHYPDQPGMRCFTASFSSSSSPMVASIFPWENSLTDTPCTTSHEPSAFVRIGIEAMIPFSIPYDPSEQIATECQSPSGVGFTRLFTVSIA